MTQAKEINQGVIHKEIDLIQACIRRMANNSFLLKGWTISLLAILLALFGENTKPTFICLVMLIPLFSFWYLDTFFLQTEKMYRKMYEWVLEKRMNDDQSKLYDLNPHRFKADVDSRIKIMFSITLRWFYGMPVIITVAIILYLLITKK